METTIKRAQRQASLALPNVGKMREVKKIIICMLVILGTAYGAMAQKNSEPVSNNNNNNNNNKLVVLWSSADAEVARKVCFTYAQKAKKQGWFDEIVLIVWGPSVKLLAEDDELKEDIIKIQEMGIKVEASISCANLYGVDQDLAELDIDIIATGVPLTNYLKEGWHILTF